MEALRATQRDKGLYYVPDKRDAVQNRFWLLVSFMNHWFNLVDLRGILRSCQAICLYPDLQLRWLYPQAPQKLSQSLYKTVLEAVDYKLWISEIIPDFASYTEQCHCISEHPEESRFLGHLATGSLERVIGNMVMLDRFQKRSSLS
jgi:hypothetical protein